MLKEKRYAFPPVKTELAGDFFTILITFAMEAAESEPYDPEGKPGPAWLVLALRFGQNPKTRNCRQEHPATMFPCLFRFLPG